MSGVLTQEIEREQVWRDRGLEDPVRVLAQEAHNARLGASHRTPGHDALTSYFSDHPAEMPGGWYA